jgi:hypothetical protein
MKLKDAFTYHQESYEFPGLEANIKERLYLASQRIYTTMSDEYEMIVRNSSSQAEPYRDPNC